MRSILLITITLLNINLVWANLSTPRDTFKTYLKAMVKIKNEQGNAVENYKTAMSTFYIKSNYSLLYEEGVVYADKLIKIIDKIKKVDYEKIPEIVNSSIWTFDQRRVDNTELIISMTKIQDQWYFSPETFQSLALYQKEFLNKKNVSGIISLTNFSDQIRKEIPESLAIKYFLLENWQWLGLLCIIIICFIIEKISHRLINFILEHSHKIIEFSSAEKISEATKPLSKMIFIFSILQLSPILDLNANTTASLKRGLYIAISLMTVWLAHKIIQYLSGHFKAKASTTETRFDDILVPLMTKTAFVIVYILGALLVANSLTIDVTGLIAGLGIGGLAFAFAAKDTLANFFGSIMLVLDRPFDIGDIIATGDIEGTVTEVGFRSTRIRTFNDSLITISNGELMNRPIDNKGKRRFRRLDTCLGLEYDTPAEKIEAFCEGIRQIILGHKWTRKDNFHVYFTQFGPSSLDIKLVVYWKTDDYGREQAEKHRLMIDILRLAKDLQVSFAFPTQTVHVLNAVKSDTENINEKYLEKGIEKAKFLIEKPISLKNPRSNFEDKNQFGDNDIGID